MNRRLAYLDAMDVEVYLDRKRPAPAVAARPEAGLRMSVSLYLFERRAGAAAAPVAVVMEPARRGGVAPARAERMLMSMLASVGMVPRAETAARDIESSSGLSQAVRESSPALVLAVGRAAAQVMLDSSDSLDAMRARVHRPDGLPPVVVTCHPAYLLKTGSAKRAAWEDVLLAAGTARMEVAA